MLSVLPVCVNSTEAVSVERALEGHQLPSHLVLGDVVSHSSCFSNVIR